MKPRRQHDDRHDRLDGQTPSRGLFLCVGVAHIRGYPSTKPGQLHPPTAPSNALRGQPWAPRFRPLLLDQTRVAAMAGELRRQLLQLAMMRTFEQASEEARQRTASLLAPLRGELAQGEWTTTRRS